MKLTRKLLTTTLIGAIALTLGACTSSTPESKSDSPEGNDVFRIAIAEIGQIGPVISVEEGIKAAFEAAGKVEGTDVEFIIKNAQGDQTMIPLMVKQLIQEEPDLIIGLGTGVIINLAEETHDIPIVFGAMTDPVDAGVVDSVESPGGNVTGTSDFLDPELILQLTREVLPQAKELGILSNAGEQNSAVQLEAIQNAVESYDFNLLVAPVTTPADAVPAALSLRDRADVVILPQDNTVGEAYEAVSDKLLEAGIPNIAANIGRVEEGLSLAGVGVNYFGLGELTGEMAMQILFEGADPATMPVQFANSGAGGGLKTAINIALADALGITIPESTLGEATVFETSPLL